MDTDDRVLWRLAATAPLWLLRYLIAGHAEVLWLVALVALDITVMVLSWRAVAPTLELSSEHGDPGSVERFWYLPAVLAAVFGFFDVLRLLRFATE